MFANSSYFNELWKTKSCAVEDPLQEEIKEMSLEWKLVEIQLREICTFIIFDNYGNLRTCLCSLSNAISLKSHLVSVTLLVKSPSVSKYSSFYLVLILESISSNVRRQQYQGRGKFHLLPVPQLCNKGS